ncbi:S-layer homology domain-containing protein [Heliobacterium chlorum]|uniref:S-layer homology domain-containing protein n=1 Tax=Heliobacterium chlorum TaxID=2698 RepID=A0ABR7T0E6_HELCL|nr:S-layer homology domain-containing protein [Heliobacterium chlorum]MBC9784262.1 S-layer homology domain-containing protein [Heliobacterium chlorum]
MRKQVVSGVLALTIVATPLSAFAAPKSFTDVYSTMYEYKPVMKLSAQGTIKGRGDGNFGPKDPVKFLEALVMAQRFFGLESTANLSASLLTAPMEKQFGGNVPGWGKGYLVTASQQNLIDVNEQFTWDKGAPRAWIARLLVRLLGKEQDAQNRMNETLSFTDADQIPAWARGHIAVATDLGLIKGTDTGAFEPNRTVTRGEMAIFLDRVEKKMSQLPPRLSEATFVSTQDNTISVLGENNLLTPLTLDPNALIFVKDRVATVSDINPQDRIRYIKDGDKVTYVEVSQESGQSANVVKGEVIAYLAEQGLITVKDETGKPLTYSAASGFKVLSLSGQAVSASNLVLGSKVQIRLNADGKAAEVLLEQESQQSLKGTIVDINLPQKFLILSDGSNHYSTYYFTDTTYVEYKGQRFTALSDLQKGDLISVEVDGSYVISKITVEGVKDNLTVSGTVSLLDKDSRIITIKGNNGQLYAYELPSSATIAFSNGTSAIIDDINTSDSVTVSVESGAVQKLTIDRSGTDSGIWGKIASVDTTRRILILKDQQDHLKSYEIKDPVVLDIEDVTSPKLSDLKVDASVEFELDRDGKINYIKVEDKLEGTVTRVDADRHLLTLLDKYGKEKIYSVSRDVDVAIYDKSREDLNDVDVDDQVRVRLSSDDTITEIQVHSQVMGEITDLSSSSDRIEITDSEGDERTYYIDSDTKLVFPGVAKPKVSDVSLHQWAVVSYWGDDAYQVTIQTPVSGEVTSVDTGRDQVTLHQYDGTSRTYNIARGFKAQKGDTSSSSLNTISVGDRIQAIMDDDDKVYRANVAKKVTGTVDGINRSTKEIYIGTNVGYLVDSSSYVMQNGVRKSFDDILHNQNVTIYYMPSYKALEVTLPK